MLIGDPVVYDGRAYIVVGFTPTSVTPAEVQLRRDDGGASFWVERRLVVAKITPERAALRIHRETPPRDDS
jgi:hypothetical protein